MCENTRRRLGTSDASPEGWVWKGVRGQVAGVVVGCGGGRVQAKRRQGGHAEVLGRVVGPEAPQLVLGHRVKTVVNLASPSAAQGQLACVPVFENRMSCIKACVWNRGLPWWLRW